jgi:hypothetical protein
VLTSEAMADFERPGNNHSQQSSTKKHQGLSTSHCCYPNLSSNRASGNGVASWSQEFLSQHGHVEPVGTVPQPDLSRALLWPALYDSALEVPRDFEAMSEFQTWPGDGSYVPQMSALAILFDDQPHPIYWGEFLEDVDRLFDDQYDKIVPENASSSTAVEPVLGGSQVVFYQTPRALKEADDSTVRSQTIAAGSSGTIS